MNKLIAGCYLCKKTQQAAVSSIPVDTICNDSNMEGDLYGNNFFCLTVDYSLATFPISSQKVRKDDSQQESLMTKVFPCWTIVSN
jgi:hypothetical protein